MKLTLCLFLSTLMAGCVSTEHIGQSPSERSYANLSQELAGQKAHIDLQDGSRQTGRITALRVDSVRWVSSDGQAVSVSTRRVRVITTNNRWAGFREGAVIGAGIGTAIFGLAARQESIGLFGAGMIGGAMAVIGGVIEGVDEGGKRR